MAEDDELLTIGHDIKWKKIVRHVFRVLEFDRAGTTIGPDDTVNAVSAFAAYGHLLVETPLMSQRLVLPINHRDDFRLAASVFDEPHWAAMVEEEELLVTYVPQHESGVLGLSHLLHYALAPRGTLYRYYSVGGDRHVTQPAPELIFGEFVWHGELRVGMSSSDPIRRDQQ